jgi:hypothetical protein
VQGQHRRPGARLDVGELADPGVHRAEPQPAGLARGAGGGQQPHAKVQVEADSQPAPLERGHAAAHVAGYPPPRGRVGDQAGVGLRGRGFHKPRRAVLD